MWYPTNILTFIINILRILSYTEFIHDIIIEIKYMQLFYLS